MRCDVCQDKQCRNDKDCFRIGPESLKKYNEEAADLARIASSIESRFYGKKNRLEELIQFAKDMNCQRLGIAFCIGLSEEAALLAGFLESDFEVFSVCCKTGAVSKEILSLEKIDPASHETMCNPIGQALLLNRAGTDLNIICGLCIGHDIQFTRYSQAPVTTFIVKDRMLGHNPAAALYCRYIRKRLRQEP